MTRLPMRRSGARHVKLNGSHKAFVSHAVPAPPDPAPPTWAPPPVVSPTIYDSVFPTNSWLRATLPSNWQVHENSAAAVAVITAELAKATPWVNTDTFTAKIHYAPPGTPYVPVTMVGYRAGNGTYYGIETSFANGVPIPDGVQPTEDADSAFVIIQPEWNSNAGRMYEFYQARSPAQNGLGHWTFAHGGRMTGTKTRGQGRYLYKNTTPHPPAWTQEGTGEYDWMGSMASNLPYSHLTIRQDDLDRSNINHPIGFMMGSQWPVAQAPSCWPAKGYDSSSTANLPQGGRLALPPGWVIDPAKPLIQKMIEACMRDHGVVLCDTSGYGLVIRSEPGTLSYYTAFPGGKAALMHALPWGNLQRLAVGSDANYTLTA